ncbi:copper resistance system multicopper oxidase [Solimonas marina]|uniref:Copper resistance system multicopper oxidase n=1 Tax=Solimonas marina TaxID=2714601 RepID=A0A969WAF6_9GAMM|nr:copper resistance system multicopper oxidase [Solimonas marina]
MSSMTHGVGGISRRRFVQGLAAGAAVTVFSPTMLPLARAAVPRPGSYGLPELSGTEFDLAIEPTAVNVTGTPRLATLVNGTLPGPLLRWREGDTVTMRVTNRLNTPSSIHWHGMLVPPEMDGVPGLSFNGIAPGETFTYRFPVRQSGTYWYHSHSGFQEQTGLFGALVIEPREADPVAADRDYVVMLNDWTDEDPHAIVRHLKTGDGYYNYQKRTLADFFRDSSKNGFAATLKERWAWGMMRMDPRDIVDVSGAQLGGTYTYLINGQPPAANWTGLFQRGEKVRLRFINGSAMSYFDVRIPGLKMTVVAADGSNVEPVSVDEFRIGVAETYDVLVEPQDDAYTIFAQSLDRSGYARATLAVREGLTAPVPPMDPIFSRTMTDMGMSMSGMGAMHGMDMSSAGGMDGMAHQPSAMTMGGGHQMSGMHDMHGAAASGMAMGGMHHGGHHGWMPPPTPPLPATAPTNASGIVAYPQPKDVHLQRGPAVVNIAASPTTRLDKPGDGLNGNGRRVLTYADLVRLDRGPQNIAFDARDPQAEVLLHLTGNMDRYIFGFNGQTYEQARPVRLPYGQRILVTLINDTMMEHPIHLHGMFTELHNSADHRRRPLKHTVSVKPGEKLHYWVTADERGRWAYHCHLLYHMEAGMFTSAEVA